MSASVDTIAKINNVRKLQQEVKHWRSMFEKTQNMPIDKDQGSNAAPAYSWYMYRYRRAFVAPQKASEPSKPIEQLERTVLDAYESSLVLEKNTWKNNTHSFASLLKEPGNVVYHPSYVCYPGYCTPSLLVEGPAVVPSLVGAAVGDRVKDNTIKAYPIKKERKKHSYYSSDSDSDSNNNRRQHQRRAPDCGVITSLACDAGTEVSVLWDNGYNQHGIYCGKKGAFHLIYE